MLKCSKVLTQKKKDHLSVTFVIFTEARTNQVIFPLNAESTYKTALYFTLRSFVVTAFEIIL